MCVCVCVYLNEGNVVISQITKYQNTLTRLYTGWQVAILPGQRIVSSKAPRFVQDFPRITAVVLSFYQLWVLG